MTKFRKILLITSVCSIYLISSDCHADQTQMQETLTRIQHLLGQVNPLINLAQSQQDHAMRVQFQFESLRQDIASIQAGIDQALQGVTIQPRLVDPLSGDYLPEEHSKEKDTALSEEDVPS